MHSPPELLLPYSCVEVKALGLTYNIKQVLFLTSGGLRRVDVLTIPTIGLCGYFRSQ